MRASSLTSWTKRLLQTQIALGCLNHRECGFLIMDGNAILVVDVHHLNIVIGAIVGAGRATNAGVVVDRHVP